MPDALPTPPENAYPILRELHYMPSRHDVWKVLNSHGLNGTAVEVGVMYGYFAHDILSHWIGQKYYCVDVWERQPEEVYKENQDLVDFDAAYKSVCDMAKEEPRMIVLKAKSVDAAKCVPDDSVDWVYIDANHSFEAVTDDMNAWWPKVRVGGLLSGHDYQLCYEKGNFIDVKPAVMKWMGEHEVQFVASHSNWWSVKMNK